MNIVEYRCGRLNVDLEPEEVDALGEVLRWIQDSKSLHYLAPDERRIINKLLEELSVE